MTTTSRPVSGPLCAPGATVTSNRGVEAASGPPVAMVNNAASDERLNIRIMRGAGEWWHASAGRNGHGEAHDHSDTRDAVAFYYRAGNKFVIACVSAVRT